MSERNSPAFAAGLADGAADADRRPAERRGYTPEPRFARSWMYRRGFARGFLAARSAAALEPETAQDGQQEPQEAIS